jgi:Uma2 family endonuclease
MTADEYLSETEETTRRRELHHGVLREPSAPFFSHQSLVLRIARIWCDHVDPRGLGRVAVAPVDVILDMERHLIVQPDVLLVATERLSIVRDQLWGAPDLVAEVLSTGNGRRDRTKKREWYRQYGVREYWMVDMAVEEVTVVDFTGAVPAERHASGIAPLQSTVLPGLRTSAFAIFS